MPPLTPLAAAVLRVGAARSGCSRSGAATGDGALFLAREFPRARVRGVDRSEEAVRRAAGPGRPRPRGPGRLQASAAARRCPSPTTTSTWSPRSTRRRRRPRRRGCCGPAATWSLAYSGAAPGAARLGGRAAALAPRAAPASSRWGRRRPATAASLSPACGGADRAAPPTRLQAHGHRGDAAGAAGQPVLGRRQGAEAAAAGRGGARRPPGRVPGAAHEEPRARGRAGAARGRGRRGAGGDERRRADRRDRRRHGRRRDAAGDRPRRPRQRPRPGARHPRPSPRRRSRSLLAGHSRRIDVGEANGKRFLGIVSVGFDSEANRLANETTSCAATSSTPTPPLRTLVGWKPARFTIAVDDERIRLSGYSVSVANSRAYGGGMYIAPDAELDDGEFDIVADRRGRQAALPG